MRWFEYYELSLRHGALLNMASLASTAHSCIAWFSHFSLPISRFSVPILSSSYTQCVLHTSVEAFGPHANPRCRIHFIPGPCLPPKTVKDKGSDTIKQPTWHSTRDATVRQGRLKGVSAVAASCADTTWRCIVQAMAQIHCASPASVLPLQQYWDGARAESWFSWIALLDWGRRAMSW